MIDVKEFRDAMDKFNRTHRPCAKCSGVGCAPENFGVGVNPGKDKRCKPCNGTGYIKRAAKKKKKKKAKK